MVPFWTLRGGLAGCGRRGFAGGGLGGLRRVRAVGVWAVRACACRRVFGGLGGLFGDGDFVGLGWGLGLLFGADGRGAGGLGGEDAVVDGALLGRQRERDDHGGLDGAGVRGFSPQLLPCVEEECRSRRWRGDENVQDERAGEVAAEVFAGEVVEAGLGELSGS